MTFNINKPFVLVNNEFDCFCEIGQFDKEGGWFELLIYFDPPTTTTKRGLYYDTILFDMYTGLSLNPMFDLKLENKDDRGIV